MLKKMQFFIFLGAYIALRLFSYFFGPETPLQGHHILNTVVSATLVALVAVLIARGDKRGWYLILLEIILGGSGNYLTAFGLTIRTWFIAVAIPLYTFRLVWKKYWFSLWQRESKMICLLGVFLTIVGLQAWHGYVNGHALKLVLADALPYAYFLYYFPLRQFLRDEKFKQLAINSLAAAIVGSALLVLLTLAGFSSGAFVLQDRYYHWYRDMASGKITELPFHFYRLVINEQLLLIPVLLFFLYARIYQRLLHPFLITLLPSILLIILSVNLTRIYLLGLTIGFVALFTLKEWRRWLATGTLTVLVFALSLTAIHLTASRGESLGWEIFGIRLQSIVSPTIEDSSLSRLLLLPKILEKISTHPILGTGLGDTVSIYSPVFKQTITTPSFDWGYLEIFAELGVFGLLMWTFIIAFIFRAYTKNQLPRWQLASFLTLLTINLTSPALFHILGVLFITFTLANITEHPDGAYAK